MDLGPLLLGLGNGDDEDSVLHLGSNAKSVDLVLVVDVCGGQSDAALKHADLALAGAERLEELLVSGAVDDSGNVELALVGVPVDADVLLDGAGERDVQDIGLLRVEGVDGRNEAVVVLLLAGLLAGFPGGGVLWFKVSPEGLRSGVASESSHQGSQIERGTERWRGWAAVGRAVSATRTSTSAAAATSEGARASRSTGSVSVTAVVVTWSWSLMVGRRRVRGASSVMRGVWWVRTTGWWRWGRRIVSHGVGGLVHVLKVVSLGFFSLSVGVRVASAVVVAPMSSMTASAVSPGKVTSRGRRRSPWASPVSAVPRVERPGAAKGESSTEWRLTS